MIQRLCFAAARIAMADDYRSVRHSTEEPGSPAEIAAHVDWDATWALRRRLDALGFGVAEAMDTAQRFSIGWETAERLIRGCGELQLANGFVAGASYDHLPPDPSPGEMVDGVAYQTRVIQEAGGVPVLLPLAPLARRRAREEEYVEVHRALLERVRGPVIVHWLGPMFLPELAGYFPGRSFERVMALDPGRVRGAKLSLLDPELELRLRRELEQRDQLLFTGDDLHFARLILGGDLAPAPDRAPPVTRAIDFGGRSVALGDFSHALLGVLDGIAAPARAALARLAAGDARGYLAAMLPLEELARWIFCEPTRFYRSGLAFLAWVNGRQSNPMLANHEERERDAAYYRRVHELALASGAIEDPELAASRLGELEDELAAHPRTARRAGPRL